MKPMQEWYLSNWQIPVSMHNGADNPIVIHTHFKLSTSLDAFLIYKINSTHWNKFLDNFHLADETRKRYRRSKQSRNNAYYSSAVYLNLHLIIGSQCISVSKWSYPGV